MTPAFSRLISRYSAPFSTTSRRISTLILAALLAAGAIGCAHKETVKLDPRFSWNVARVLPEFPDKKTPLSPAEQEVMARRGKPNFIRIWWKPDGSLIKSSDLAGRRDEQGQIMTTSTKSWIYTNDGKEMEEVLFIGNGYKVRPLEEKLKLICTYGDPSTRMPPVVREGRTYETWQWMEHGLQVELMDGQEISRTNFEATGAGTYILK